MVRVKLPVTFPCQRLSHDTLPCQQLSQDHNKFFAGTFQPSSPPQSPNLATTGASDLSVLVP